MSEKTHENYTFFFKDGYYVTFPLTKKEFELVKSNVLTKLECALLENYVITLTDLRYIAKQDRKDVESAIPEYLDQDTYEFIKEMERGDF